MQQLRIRQADVKSLMQIGGCSFHTASKQYGQHVAKFVYLLEHRRASLPEGLCQTLNKSSNLAQKREDPQWSNEDLSEAAALLTSLIVQIGQDKQPENGSSKQGISFSCQSKI